MDRARSFTLVWVPRRNHLVVSSANHRSTRFIHDDDVGVKWNWKRGWRTSQRWIAGVLWVEELSSTTWTASGSGTDLSTRFRKRRNSSARWRGVMSAITWPEATSSAA